MTSLTSPPAALNKFEKLKAEKDGLLVKHELEHFAQIGWEAMSETDRDYRLKWLGVFFSSGDSRQIYVAAAAASRSADFSPDATAGGNCSALWRRWQC